MALSVSVSVSPPLYPTLSLNTGHLQLHSLSSKLKSPNFPPSLLRQCIVSSPTPTLTSSSSDTETETDTETERSVQEKDEDSESDSRDPQSSAASKSKKKRYGKEYPGESKGITEEMRFVAMRLRNDKDSKKSVPKSDEQPQPSDENEAGESNGGGQTWEPSMDGFLKYLVDSKLVFETLERIVQESDDISYSCFKRTGLERSECLAKDLEWFGEQDIAIPEPSNPGVSYATYLKELAKRSAPLFLIHFYNANFSHIAGGQVIAKQVAGKLVQGKELEFYKWERDSQELLKEVRLNLNKLSEPWTRDVKNKCLKEASKSFKNMGQIVRLIIL